MATRKRRLLRALFSCVLPHDHRAPMLAELDEAFSGDDAGFRRQVLRSLPHACRLRARRWRMGSIGADVRSGIRALTRAPWYFVSTAAVIALSLAFGVTAFAIVDGALFRPLPYRDADRIVMVSPAFSTLPPRPSPYSASLAELDAWIAALPGATIGWADNSGRATLSRTESVISSQVTEGYLDALGVTPLFGGFRHTDFDAFNQVQPALLTHSFWLERFGGDAGVLGRTLTGDGGNGIHIVGVLPPRFAMPGPWIPKVLTPLAEAGSQPRYARSANRQTIVRLPAELTQPEAAARLLAATLALAAEWPPPSPSRQMTEAARIQAGPADAVRMVPIRDALTVRVKDIAWVVLVSSLFLVVLACLNVSALAAARVADRWRDLSVRRALGARPFDLFRLLTAEHTVVVFSGVVAGWLAAKPLLTATLSMMPAYVLLQDAEIDLRVLVFAAGLAILCLGAIAIVSARTVAGMRALRQAASDGATTARSRPWLIASQVAVATVVLVGSSLVVGSLLRVRSEALGFETDSRALLSMGMPRGASAPQIEAIVDDLRRQPGVRGVGATDRTVLQRVLNWSVFDPPDGPGRSEIGSFAVTSGYLDALGVRLLDGRLPTDAEVAAGRPVAVMSTTAARAYWPDDRAVGRTLSLGGRPFVVVGIVQDGRYGSWESDPVGDIYFPMAAAPEPRVASVVVALAPATTTAGIAKAFAAACPECRVFSSRSVDDALSSTIQARRFRGWLFAAYGLVALVITATGVLGVVAMTTARRAREIGIRLALGATRPGVVRTIVREQLLMLMLGVVAGGLVAAASVRFLTTYLYKAGVYDPLSWAGGIVVLCLVVVGATVLPSIRATRVDLVRALTPE